MYGISVLVFILVWCYRKQGWDKTRNRNDGMAERNGKAERMGIIRGTERRNGMRIKRGTERRNGMGIKRGTEWRNGMG